MSKISTIEKVKISILLIGVLGVWVLAQRISDPVDPPHTYESTYEAVKGLKQDLEGAFNTKGPQELMYSYIPAYSHVYTSEGNSQGMAITLSLRNVDSKKEIKILQVSYFNTKGELIRRYLKEGYSLSPLETKEIFIKKSDLEGGSGANFVVLFTITPESLPPIFETIMTDDSSGSNSYFSSQGVIYPVKN